jgi:ferredoxin
MIVAELKPFEEIKKMVKDHKKVMVLGCGTCVTVCMSGGERQVELLASSLRMAGKLEGNEIIVGEKTILRQCDPEFIEQIKDEASGYDAVLSMACGAGVQGIAEKLEGVRILPAMNTTFLGMANGQGTWVQVCAACGDCILHETGGICPVARCAKKLISGPCGGARGGKCEVSKDNPCAWQLIYKRLGKMKLIEILKGMPVPRKRTASPRRMTIEGLGGKKESAKE